MSDVKQSKRIVSIDALRGFDMFWIIGGDQIFTALFTLIGTGWALGLKTQLEHCSWHGFHFYDLIFPLFLFLMGAAMPFSISKRLKRGESKKSIYRHVIQRSLILILLGLIKNGLFGFDFVNLRYAGVLQRIGLTYFFAAVIVMHWQNLKTQIYIAAGILLSYWALLALVPVPGFGMNVLTMEGNLASWIDRLFLPGSFCCFEHGDNEGILSTLPAIVNVLIGVQAGSILKSDQTDGRKLTLLLAAGGGCIVTSLLWNPFFSINKLIWTSSYVLLSGGLSLVILALFFWIIDMRGWKTWAFVFIVIGMNPITIYVAQGIIKFYAFTDFFVHGFIDHLGSAQMFVYFSLVFLSKWLFLYFLYRHKIFVKV